MSEREQRGRGGSRGGLESVHFCQYLPGSGRPPLALVEQGGFFNFTQSAEAETELHALGVKHVAMQSPPRVPRRTTATTNRPTERPPPTSVPLISFRPSPVAPRNRNHPETCGK